MTKQNLQFYIAYEKGEGGGYIASAPAIRGCVVRGKTLKEAHKNIQAAIKECLEGLAKFKKEKPDGLSTEKLFFAKNVKTALVIGEVRGIILAVAEKNGLPIKEFAPLEVKVAICGYGRASKENVASMLKLSIKMPKNKLLDDETDALALALTSLVSVTFP